MPTTSKPMTDARLRTLKYKPLASKGEKNEGQLLGNRIADTNGMYVFCSPTGTISFRYDFRWPRSAKGKRQCITYGRYPITTLEQARDDHIDALRKLRDNINPMLERSRTKQAGAAAAANTFKAVGDRWYDKNKKGKSISWTQANRRYLDVAYQTIGAKPIKEVTTHDMHAIIRAVERDGRAATAANMRMVYAQVFDHAAGDELIIESGFNPARVLSVDVPKSKTHPHLKANEIPEFLRAIDETGETVEQTKLAARLVLLVITRKMELLGARWSELDLDAARWEIPPGRMKGGRTHVVPLSSQAVALFRRLRELSSTDCVFPNVRNQDKPMNRSTLTALLDRLGYKGKVTIHGLRGTASTILNELGYRSDVIEKQLAHVEADEVRAAYNHADYMTERRKMLQDWADAIDRLCAGKPLRAADDNVIQLQTKVA